MEVRTVKAIAVKNDNPDATIVPGTLIVGEVWDFSTGKPVPLDDNETKDAE